eukprot:gene19289-23058_t
MAMAPEGAPAAEQSPQDEAAVQTDECSANADCDACLKQTNCVWCTEIVEFHDGSQGSKCLFHDPFRKTRRFKCPGVFSDKSCAKGEKGMEFLEKVQEQAEAIKDNALSAVEDAKENAVGAVQDAAEDVKDKAVGAAEDVKNKTVDAVQSKVEEMKGAVVDAMQKVLPFDISGGEADNKTSEKDDSAATAEVGQPSQTAEEGAAIAPAGQPSPEAAEPKVEKPNEPQEPGANRPNGKLTHMDKLRKRKQERRQAEGKKDVKGKVQKKFGKS